jgi:hypothetical protein
MMFCYTPFTFFSFIVPTQTTKHTLFVIHGLEDGEKLIKEEKRKKYY